MSGTLDIKVTGPATATDNAAVRYDATTGKIVQDSSVIIDDSNAITGVTSLDVDNIKVDGNTVSSTDTDGDINLSPNGTGTVVINTDLDVDNININGNTVSSTDTDGAVVIDPNGTGEITLGAATVSVEQYITHSGDTNNFVEFGTDTQDFQTGGSSRMDISDSGVRFGAANARITTVLDEDAMGSDSATALCTQQSIKAYVDNSVTTSEYKQSVVTSTTGALTVTYDNGSSGVGATLTNAGAQAVFELDGVSATVGQRVLIKDQAAAEEIQNGVYTVTDVGSGSTNWVLTRATDCDQVSEMPKGILVTVDSGGTTNALTSWMLTSDVSAIGTDAVTFSQFTYGTVFPTLTVDNLNLNGNTIISEDVNGDINLSPNGSGTVVINTDLDVDNINVNGNTIISTDTDGDINLSPNGTGTVVINTDLDVDNLNLNGNTIISTDTDGNINLTPNGTGLNVLANAQVTNVTASRAVVTDASSNLNESATTAAEIGYVSGVTSAIQTQLGTKVSSGGSSTDNAIARFDLATGYLLQDSSVLIDDSNAMSGVTELDVDNININGNTIISTDTDGDIVITPNGTGTVVIDADVDIDNLNLDGNSIISTDTDGDINLSPNGTGTVVINTDLDVDNININGNTIISTDTDGNINLTPNGTGLNVLANAQVTNITASRAVVTDASSNLNESATTATELGYVSGVTSSIQTQINNIAVADGVVKYWGDITYTTGTPAITASYNLTSITDVAEGRILVTVATDFSSANWAPFGMTASDTTSENPVFVGQTQQTAITAGAVEYYISNHAGAIVDPTAGFYCCGMGEQ